MPWPKQFTPARRPDETARQTAKQSPVSARAQPASSCGGQSRELRHLNVFMAIRILRANRQPLATYIGLFPTSPNHSRIAFAATLSADLPSSAIAE
jgi:hypothetical protein